MCCYHVYTSLYSFFIRDIFLLQYSKGCLDVALQLLQGLSADERRSAATITKNIVAQVNMTCALMYICCSLILVDYYCFARLLFNSVSTYIL